MAAKDTVVKEEVQEVKTALKKRSGGGRDGRAEETILKCNYCGGKHARERSVQHMGKYATHAESRTTLKEEKIMTRTFSFKDAASKASSSTKTKWSTSRKKSPIWVTFSHAKA
jgi:hypothetical protein